MPPKYDIFISYGHLDDEDPAGDVKGWVDLLVERLPRLVSSSLGYIPKVWRDQRSLTGDALLTAAIEEGISNSLLFVPIVTPRYVQSDWCLREVEAFSKNPPIPNAPAHRSRIFKVVKSPLLFHLAKRNRRNYASSSGMRFTKWKATCRSSSVRILFPQKIRDIGPCYAGLRGTSQRSSQL